MKTLTLATLSLLSLVPLVGPVACTKGSNDAPAALLAPSGGGGAPTPTQATGGPKVINLPKFGLKGTAAGETEDPIIGNGDPSLIMAATFTVNLSEAKPSDPKKIKDGEAAAKMYSPKNMQSETLADGWVLTYENTGSAGANYFVSVRRDIGGKGYLCETMQSTPAQQKAALDFCKSLTK
jgi:hypothetical protein